MASPEIHRIRGFLKRVIGNGVGSIIPLTEKANTIGRNRNCGIWFDDVNVSRKHCILQQTSVGWTITDCGGINGTYLNGNRLESKTPAPLEDGNVVFLGHPVSTTYGFLFMKTIDTEPSATIENSVSSKVTRPTSPALETSLRGSLFKREIDSPTSSTDASKRLKTDFTVSSSVGGDAPRPCEEPIPGPSFRSEHINIGDSSQTYQISTNRLTASVRSDEPIPGTSSRTCSIQKEVADSTSRANRCASTSRANKRASTSRANKRASISRGNEPILGRSAFFIEPSDSEEECLGSYVFSSSTRNCEPIAGPSHLSDRDSAVGGDVSDSSVASDDSLKTRIRKTQKRESQNFSRSHHSRMSIETSLTSKMESDCSLLCSPQKVLTVQKLAVAAGKELMPKKIVEPGSSCRLDTDSEDSESLLPAQPPHDVSLADDPVENQFNKSLENTKPLDQESTIQYLKERVLKLHKDLLEANCELKNMNLENKKQKQLIEVLKSSQGISHEQLIKVLEDELCCNICTEIFIKPITLKCAHTFCEHCISVWKKKKKQCPMCREPITSETAIKVLDNLISRAVEYLDESYQTRRSELMQTRVEEKVKMNKKPKRRIASRRRRSSQIRIQRIENNFPVTSPTNPVQQALQLSDFGLIEMVPLDEIAGYGTTSTPYASGIEIQISEGSDSSSVEGSGYYGGFGRCYNCGRRGHWANGCPD